MPFRGTTARKGIVCILPVYQVTAYKNPLYVKHTGDIFIILRRKLRPRQRLRLREEP